MDSIDSEVKKIHENIRRIRIEKGWTILRLSTESGISRSHLYYIETMKTSPSIETLDRIAKTLGMHLIDFFE